MIALDLFAGSGWHVGAEGLGIEELGVEIMDEAFRTREANGMRTVYRDVWEGVLDPAIVPAHDLLIASPPCQSFSTAGHGAGRAALDDVLAAIRSGIYKRPMDLFELTKQLDDRTALVLTPIAHVFRERPRLVVFEQVPPVLPVWEACAAVMREWGYSVAVGVLNAEQYGMVWACPLHIAPSAAPLSDLATVPANARASATTRYDSEWTAHARNAVGSWVRGTSRDGASVATSLARAATGATWEGSDRRTRTGPEVAVWTSVGTSEFGLEAGIVASIESSWNHWLVESSLYRKWCTTSMERRITTIRAILSSIAATLTTGFVIGQATRAVDCGLCLDVATPQTRRRAILVARRDGKVAELPTPTHSRYHHAEPWRTDDTTLRWHSMADAIGWGMTKRPFVTLGNACLRAEGVGGSGAKRAIYREKDAGQWREGGQFPLTAQEAATLQSYPPGFEFAGTKTMQALQIGNCVPPLLAWAILAELTSTPAPLDDWAAVFAEADSLAA